MTTDNATGAPASGPATGSPLRHWPTVARILMGLVFFASGLAFFTLPPPKAEMPEAAMAFAVALQNTGYMMRLIMGTQLLVGVLLLSNRFVPLALALIAPIIVGIITFHVFLAPAGIVPGVVVLLLELSLAWAYRNAFCPMLAAKNKPN